MKKIWILAFLILLINATQTSFAENFSALTSSKVYSEGQPLIVYGSASSNENIIVRLFAPDGTIVKFDQITTNDDGSFSTTLLTWPKSSINFPFGTYTVEVINAKQQGISEKIDVKFESTSDLVEVPVQRSINTLVFVPEMTAVNTPIRVFVQVTSDGLLVAGDPAKLLTTTHVHLPNGDVVDLANSFKILHQGLYYTDYTPKILGTYVFHVVTFHQGTVSHGSAATLVQSQDIGGISKQIIDLNTSLDETSKELDKLKSEIAGFGSSLESASTNIDKSVSSMSRSVGIIEEASVQLNSLFFPIVASIGIIVALQIVIIARRR